MPAGHESDDEALFAALENEDDLSYRDQRIQQLNAELASQKTNHDKSNTNHGTGLQSSTYPTLNGDQSVLNLTTDAPRCIIHFAHDDFARCGVMDARLEELAGRHYEVRFARVDVRSTPFLAEKLGIRVLPCVIGFKDGVGVDRVVGFEGLGNLGVEGTESFSVQTLEKRLLYKKVLTEAKFSSEDDDEVEESGSDDDTVRRRRPAKAIRSGNTGRNHNDDDDDWE
ncbi:hypothetical protein N7448_005570 [Penicillium atrosanguineum]|uniref:uncharacterized protein n=1 Tax=Penicillium atrosanguineum TaxID=1132637 RepID=UPI0023967D76|nr:uncharacterized protein N7443_009303 [Penicillium atrosanguineum]KAJ5126259.1 hypothetical protein N7526_008436 [Penicillium atrosanguineum]KAJ5137016.1 hypothetical protein N7448_005570 [Penicillium atrosanguineum]KAJ5293350.1 hypothetical protein N7443_009303 [Penicillium atrosanguineum]